MKKAQIIGQVFIYILTVVVIGIIVLLGYRAISGIINQGCRVDEVNFKTDIESFISKYSAYGSVNKESMPVPCSYTQVCFVSNDKIINPNGFSMQNKLIEAGVKSGVQQNVFLIDNKKMPKAIAYSEKINATDQPAYTGYICINPTNGKFNILFTGRGSTVVIGTFS